MTKLKLVLAATLLLVPFTVVKSEADGLQDALARGSLRVGMAEENYVPWLASGKSGERIGFEIDVATGVSNALGVPPEFINVPFDNLLKSLVDGDVDVVISGVSVTAERAKEVYFSTPYAATDFTVVVDKTLLPPGAAENGYDVEGVKIGVAANTVAEYVASSEFQAAEVVSFDDNGIMRDAFLEGEVHGVVAPTPYPVFIVSRDPERYEMEQAPLLSTVEAMVVRPDSPNLLNFLNAWIVENKASGTFADLTTYWFESGEWLDNLEGYTSEADQTDSGSGGTNE